MKPATETLLEALFPPSMNHVLHTPAIFDFKTEYENQCHSSFKQPFKFAQPHWQYYNIIFIMEANQIYITRNSLVNVKH